MIIHYCAANAACYNGMLASMHLANLPNGIIWTLVIRLYGTISLRPPVVPQIRGFSPTDSLYKPWSPGFLGSPVGEPPTSVHPPYPTASIVLSTPRQVSDRYIGSPFETFPSPTKVLGTELVRNITVVSTCPYSTLPGSSNRDSGLHHDGVEVVCSGICRSICACLALAVLVTVTKMCHRLGWGKFLI